MEKGRKSGGTIVLVIRRAGVQWRPWLLGGQRSVLLATEQPGPAERLEEAVAWDHWRLEQRPQQVAQQQEQWQPFFFGKAK